MALDEETILTTTQMEPPLCDALLPLRLQFVALKTEFYCAMQDKTNVGRSTQTLEQNIYVVCISIRHAICLGCTYCIAKIMTQILGCDLQMQ